MSKQLPSGANLDQLKKQAKELLKSFKSGDAEAKTRLGESDASSGVSLHDAQRAIAREYGFASWPKLKQHIESLRVVSDPAKLLKAAIVANDVDAVRLTLAEHPELKAKLNDAASEEAFGSTPLLVAVRHGNEALVDALLTAGADINQRSHWWAGSFGVLDYDHGMAPFLISRGANVDVNAAARLGMIDKLRELLAVDRRVVHARGGDGQTPLHVAATVEIAECLLEYGAMIDAMDVDHESTPAQYLVRDHPDVARFLMARGCRTVLLMAAALGDLAWVRHHLDINPGCIRMCVSPEYFPKRNPKAGGTIYIWTLGQNKTAHALAREFGHKEILQLLIDRSPIQLKLADACEQGDEGTVDALLASEPDIARQLSEDDRRKLAHAAQSNDAKAVELMLKAGWPVDVTGQNGATALHWAGINGNAAMARIILRHNPPLEVADKDFGGKPLGWTMWGSVHGWHKETGDYAGTAEALLAAGAKPPEEPDGSPEVEAVIRAALRRAKK